MLEVLEARIAPAVVIPYTDVDGDAVTVTISKGSASDVSTTFISGGIFGAHLARLNLMGNAVFTGANITISAVPQDVNGDGFLDGDGRANIGFLDATGLDLGTVKIAGDVGKIAAGSGGAGKTGLKSLAVASIGRMGTVTGAPDNLSNVLGKVGTLSVPGDVLTNVTLGALGTGTVRGSVQAILNVTGALGKLTIGGNLDGIVQGQSIGSISIGGTLSGILGSNSTLETVSIGIDMAGAMLGQAGSTKITVGVNWTGSGLLNAMSTGKIGGELRGVVQTAGDLQTLTIGESVFGEATGANGRITAGRDLGTLKIGGNLYGSGPNGVVSVTGKLTSATITGSVFGGSIKAATAGKLSIGGDLRGGGAANSGTITGGSYGSIAIGGSLVGGRADSTGLIDVTGAIGSLRIGGDFEGGYLLAGENVTRTRAGYIEAGRINSVTIGGSMLVGQDDSASGQLVRNGSIRVDNDLGSLSVKHDLRGSVGAGGKITLAVITARGQDLAGAERPTDVAIGKLTVGGIVFRADIRAGYDVDQAAKNADAQIGTVTVGSDWRASDLTAGVEDNGLGFGDSDDGKIAGAGIKDLSDASGAISRIGSVTIGGSVVGTVTADTERFGIEAQQVGAVTVGGVKALLRPGSGTDAFPLRVGLGSTRGSDLTVDTAVFEIGPVTTSTPVAFANAKAPAKFALKYTDVDGDLVVVTLSKGSPEDVVFTLSAPSGPYGGQQLQAIDFGTSTGFTGANLTITATPQDADSDGLREGDGRANVGVILNTNSGAAFDLGAITVDGDLGAVKLFGDVEGAPTLKSLAVASMGLYGTSTGATDLQSSVVGGLGSVKIAGEMATGVKLGGSVVTSASIGTLSGEMSSAGSTLTIAHDLTGSVVAGRMKTLIVGGSIRGGSSVKSGYVEVSALGSGRIGGSLIAGAADNSGKITAREELTSLTVGGSVVGGAGLQDLGAGVNRGAGQIFATERLGSITIGHNFIGGGGELSAAVLTDMSGIIDSIAIGGSVLGGAGGRSAYFLGGDLNSLIVKGDWRGGSGPNSADTNFVFSQDSDRRGSISIGGSIQGGSNTGSGRLIHFGELASLTIGGSLTGGAAGGSGNVQLAFSRPAKVSIGGSIVGAGTNTGQLILDAADTLTVRGDVTGGSAASAGARLPDESGMIRVNGALARGTVGGSLRVGLGTDAFPGSGDNGSLSFGQLGTLTIKGSLVGNLQGALATITATGQAGLPVTAVQDTAIKGLTIGGRLERAMIRAGYIGESVTNADAQIGTVLIGGDWVASFLIAGVNAVDGIYGNGDDVKGSGGFSPKDNDDALGAISRIASVVIKGNAYGTPSRSDAALFTIEAQQIGSVSVGGRKEPLQAGAGNDLFALRDPLGATFANNDRGDFNVIEIAAPATP